MKDVFRENCKVGELARSDGSFDVVLALGIGRTNGVGVDSLRDRYLLFGNPTVGVLAVECAARGGRIDAGKRIDGGDKPVRAEGQRDSGIEERAEGIGGGSALVTDALLGPAAVIDGVIRLH